MTTTTNPTWIKSITKGSSKDLIPNISDNENEINTKVGNMIQLLMEKGMIKYLEIEKSKGTEDLKNMDNDEIIKENYITPVYSVNDGERGPMTWIGVKNAMNIKSFKELIDAPKQDLMLGFAVLYYKALKACLASKLQAYRLHKVTTVKEKSDDIKGISKTSSYKSKSVKSVGEYETNKICITYIYEYWKQLQTTSISQIIFGVKYAFIDNLYKYGVITLSDFNAFLTIFMDNSNNACKFIRDNKKLGVIALPTTKAERNNIKEADAHLRSVKKKMFSKINEKDKENYYEYDESLESISTLSSFN